MSDAPVSDNVAWLLRSQGLSVPSGVPDAAPMPLAARPRPRAVPRAVPVAAPPPDDDPDLPFLPMNPGGDGLAAAGAMPDAVTHTDDVSTGTAHTHLAAALRRLARVVADPNTETGDMIAACREMARIEAVIGGRTECKEQRSVGEVDAELCLVLRGLGWTVTPTGSGAA